MTLCHATHLGALTRSAHLGRENYSTCYVLSLLPRGLAEEMASQSLATHTGLLCYSSHNVYMCKVCVCICFKIVLCSARRCCKVVPYIFHPLFASLVKVTYALTNDWVRLVMPHFQFVCSAL